MMSEIKWIKILTNIFDDEKMKFIEHLPDGDTIIVIWFKILTLAGRSNKDGYIMLTDQIPYTEEMLRSYLNRKETIIKLAFETFKRLGMIEVVDEQYLLVSNWSKHQNVAGLEKIRKQARERQARYVERRKTLLLEDKELKEEKEERDIDTHNVKNNVSNDVIDNNKNKKDNFNTKEHKDKAKIDEILSTYSDELKEAIDDYLEMRKKNNNKFTVNAKKRLLMKLEGLAKDEKTKLEIVENALISNWKSFYELKSNQPNKPKSMKDNQTSLENNYGATRI